MTRTRGLAAWVGQGRPVTPKGVLRRAEVAAVATELGVAVPAWVRTAADVEVIHRPWVASEALGLIRVEANRAVAVPASQGDPLEQWWTAVSAVLRAESHDRRRVGAAILCRTVLTILAMDPPPPVADLEKTVRDVLHGLDYRDHAAVVESFRRDGVPVDAGRQLLAEIGAVDQGGRLSPLGRWMLERMAAETPPPVTADLSAAEVLGRLVKLPEDEVWQQAVPWLRQRDTGQAAADLLAAASTAAPAERVVAVEVVAGIGEPAVPAWRRALEDPMLAPHVRSVLGGLDGIAEPGSADGQWLAVEFALAALATEGPQEAYLVLQDLHGLEAVAASRHPGAATLRDALADLIAAGGPAVPTYQLKIALVRMRQPVWRRLLLPATITLDALHRLIQVAFDWDGDHLHRFTVDGRRYADPFFPLDGCADESRVRLSKVLPRVNGSMSYVYDMGDWWEHQIRVEKIIEPNGLTGPRCIDGQGDAPVEDWSPDCGREPTPFDAAAINRRFAELDDVTSAMST